MAPKGRVDFASLPEEEQAAVREAQRARKAAKTIANATGAHGGSRLQEGSDGAASAPEAMPQLATSRNFSVEQQSAAKAAGQVCNITSNEYFDASPGGLFRDPNLKPTEANLQLLLRVLSAGDEQAKSLNTCNYFQFAGSAKEIWDPRFNARMAYEGFFTITTSRRRTIEPLPELQPFYSVVAWPSFEASSHVRKALKRLRRGDRQLYIANCLNPKRTWELLDAYHRKKYGTNWLTKQYFEMFQAASSDETINFKLQCIEMYSTENKAKPLAGEIGFSIGKVYTSLSGWTEERTHDGFGTAQLALLGRWLQHNNFVFWSLGHCYSPEMDYKRQLGHRVLPRYEFLALLKAHRGAFEVPRGSNGDRSKLSAFQDSETCEASVLLEDVETCEASVTRGSADDPPRGVVSHVAEL